MVKSQEELAEIFQIPLDEQPLEDFGCAIAQDILIHGRLYITNRNALFHSKIFGFTTIEKIPLREIASIERANTAKFIPNAIELYTHSGKKYVFTSFAFRDAAYRFLALLWRVANDLPALPADQEGDTTGTRPTVQQTENSDDVTATEPGSATATVESDAGSTVTTQQSTPPRKGSSSAKSSTNSTNDNKNTAASSSDKSAVQGGASSSEAASKASAAPAKAEPRSSSTPITVGQAPRGKRPDVHDKEHVAISKLSAAVVDRMKEVVNELLPVTVPEYYKLFFEDNTFTREFHEARGDTELDIEEWVEQDDGSRARNVNFRTKLDHKIGPKSTRVQEHQVIRHDESGPILLQTSTRTPDVPYGESFTVETRYSVTEAPDGQGAWMYVTIGVHFQKSIWIKGIIERGAVSGAKDYFGKWRQVAVQLVARYRDGQFNLAPKGEVAEKPAVVAAPPPVQTIIKEAEPVDLEVLNPLAMLGVSTRTLLLVLSIIATITVLLVIPSVLFRSAPTPQPCPVVSHPSAGGGGAVDNEAALALLRDLAVSGSGSAASMGAASVGLDPQYWEAVLARAEGNVAFARRMLSLVKKQSTKDTEL